jgi:cytoskeletal protein RodZ
MLLVLVPLFVISLLSLITGAIWLLAGSGRNADREGQEITTDPSSDLSSDSENLSFSERTASNANHDNSASKVSYSFPDIKNEMRDGHWGTAGPLLMAVGGFLGVLLFGSLVLLVVIDDRILGSLIAVIATITVLRVTIAMIRA